MDDPQLTADAVDPGLRTRMGVGPDRSAGARLSGRVGDTPSTGAGEEGPLPSGPKPVRVRRPGHPLPTHTRTDHHIAVHDIL
ncbi:hypothetical protein GCM10010343_21310 [Streptomyces avidinii]|nr:hypothetical protein GCM10010343_21310 [Streptomyces avidinii]